MAAPERYVEVGFSQLCKVLCEERRYRQNGYRILRYKSEDRSLGYGLSEWIPASCAKFTDIADWDYHPAGNYWARKRAVRNTTTAPQE